MGAAPAKIRIFKQQKQSQMKKLGPLPVGKVTKYKKRR